jgi:N-acetylglucosaminyl-diphospho-decaprenol L-rhamnosyltransferase
MTPPSPSGTGVVTVVVVTYNSAEVIEGLLDSLPAALGALPADIVVVDNSSTDETCAVVSGRSGCRLVVQPNAGYSAGINRGVAESGASGPILVLNPDVRLAPGAVEHLVAALRDPRTGIAVPRVRDPDGRVSWSLRREPSLGRSLGLGRTGHPRLSEYVAEPSAYEREHACDWALGAVMLVSRACHEALGGWDESYFLYSEETDFCLRARDGGLATVYVPHAEAVHIGGASGQSGRTHAMQAVNRVRLFHRRHGRLRGWLYFTLTVAGEVSRLLRGNRRSATALSALLLPGRRPRELALASGYLPL